MQLEFDGHRKLVEPPFPILKGITGPLLVVTGLDERVLVDTLPAGEHPASIKTPVIRNNFCTITINRFMMYAINDWFMISHPNQNSCITKNLQCFGVGSVCRIAWLNW